MKKIKIPKFYKLINEVVGHLSICDVGEVEEYYIIYMENLVDKKKHFIKIYKEIQYLRASPLLHTNINDTRASPLLHTNINDTDTSWVINFEDIQTMEKMIDWIWRRINGGVL
jgi:hypothetical protein